MTRTTIMRFVLTSCAAICVSCLVLAGQIQESAKASSSGAAPIVTVTGGQIRGVMLEKGGAVFKGIPYAQPPVGDLRWREPMPVKPWSGIRDATAFGPPCAQNPYFISNAKEVSKED